MSEIFAICNQKGGVGKTTTAVNIATFIALTGKKTLLIDFDPQGNATSGVGVDKNTLTRTIYDVIINGLNIKETILKSRVAGLEIIPSASKLAGAEVELVNLPGREKKLKNSLEKIKDKYDYIIIDCPPSLSLLTINALTAASKVIIPIQCEYYALEGLSNLVDTLDLVRANLNPQLQVKGIVLTMYDSRTLLSQEVAEEAKEHFATKVFKTIVPRNVRLSESPSFGQPIIYYDPTCSGSIAYENLTKEILAEN